FFLLNNSRNFPVLRVAKVNHFFISRKSFLTFFLTLVNPNLLYSTSMNSLIAAAKLEPFSGFTNFIKPFFKSFS
ncbi:hypothetical protein, partial [Flavobacterium sp. CAU 1735]|uniref:hypothetical protein n=1 Tax=Flavobacterium sp. CAU 1735 TaxID=3140361 RepID=UPI0032606778